MLSNLFSEAIKSIWTHSTNMIHLSLSKTFFRKMTTSNEAFDSILDVDDVQTSSNIYDDDDQS